MEWEWFGAELDWESGKAWGNQGPLLYVYTIFRAYCFEFVQCACVLLPLLHARGRRGCLSGWGSSFLSIYLPTYVITAAAWHASALLYCKLILIVRVSALLYRAFPLPFSLYLTRYIFLASVPCEADRTTTTSSVEANSTIFLRVRVRVC